MTTHYVDNKKLYACIVEYRQSVLDAKEKGITRPRIPNYVGECILMIANRLSTKPNFVNYSYREEMISDGVENCICYIDNFDPLKSTNPFAYFTQIIYYAFLRRIQKEKKQLYIKYKSTEQMGVLDEDVMFESPDGQVKQFEMYDNIAEFIENFEDSQLKKKETKKVTKKLKGMEKFVE